MRRYRITNLIILAVLGILLAGGAGKLIGGTIATPAASVAATLAPTPTREVEAHSTPRPVVVTAIRTAEPAITVETTADLNLRDAPAGHVVGSVRTGAVLRVKIAGKWAEVVAGEHRGKFVAAAYVRPAK